MSLSLRPSDRRIGIGKSVAGTFVYSSVQSKGSESKTLRPGGGASQIHGPYYASMPAVYDFF